MMDILFNPLAENGGFVSRYVEIEKDVLRESLLQGSTRGAYALERCIEEMCKGEPYSIHEDGNIEDLDRITPQSLFMNTT